MILLAVLATAVVPLPSRVGATPVASADAFLFTGGGWGHGIGLSQYGAYGRGEARVKKLNQGARFRIQTPEGVAAVRGTDFRVGHKITDASGLATTETVTGHVDFIRGNQPTDLPAGFGVAASPQGVTKESLLPAPTWDSQASGSSVTYATGDQLAWQALAGADSYFASVAPDNEPNTPLLQLPTSDTLINLAIAPGKYLARVRGISAAGIEGFDAQQAITVVQPGPQLIALNQASAGQLDLSWSALESATEYELAIKESSWSEYQTHTTTSNKYQLSLGPGQYEWFVDTPESQSSETSQFVLNPRPPERIRTRTNKFDATITWEANEAEQTRVQVFAAKAPSQMIDEQLVSTDDLQVKLPGYGRYVVRLASIHGKLQSEQVQTIVVARNPWWLLLLTAPLLAL